MSWRVLRATCATQNRSSYREMRVRDFGYVRYPFLGIAASARNAYDLKV